MMPVLRVRAVIAAILALLWPMSLLTQAQAARPNIIFILADDQRYDALGFLDPVLETPNIDRMAREGVHFRNAFVTTSLCSPSRASILTGRYMHRQGLLYEYYWEYNYPHTPTTFALRGDRYKLIQYHGVWDTEELYDLQEDPKETRNLIADPALQEVVREMRAGLFQMLNPVDGRSTVTFPSAAASARFSARRPAPRPPNFRSAGRARATRAICGVTSSPTGRAKIDQK